MTPCLVPSCSAINNGDRDRYCSTCGHPLLLQDCYRPIRSIGEGGFGRTFLAEDVSQPQRPKCVIKQLCERTDNAVNAQAKRMFHQEAIRLQQLSEHPQIPKLLTYFEQDAHQYLVQQHIDGWDLQSEMQTEGPFDENKIWQVLEEISQILRFVHENQVIHRDIKPRNIMRCRQGGQLVLIDFGVAKLLKPDGQKTPSRTLVGSPEYMAPEQTQGKVVSSSDLYSLGVTCLFLLTGRPPLELYSPANDFWYWREALPKGRQLSDRLAVVLDRLLQTPIKNRFPSAKALSIHLLACQSAR